MSSQTVIERRRPVVGRGRGHRRADIAAGGGSASLVAAGGAGGHRRAARAAQALRVR